METLITNTKYEWLSDYNCFEYKNLWSWEQNTRYKWFSDTAVLNTKISEAENKIPDNSKYIITQEFNKWMVENFAARLKQANLVSKTDFDNKLANFNRRTTSNKVKYLEVQKKVGLQKKLKVVIKKLSIYCEYGRTFDSAVLWSFDNDFAKNGIILVLIRVHYFISTIARITFWC